MRFWDNNKTNLGGTFYISFHIIIDVEVNILSNCNRKKRIVIQFGNN